MTTPALGYRAPVACAVAGISYRQLDYWARTGVVAPSVAEAEGAGGRRLYAFRDIVALKVVKRLLDAGVSLQSVRRAITTLRRGGEDDLATMTLISDGRTVYQCRSAEEIVDLLQGGQGVFAIAISGSFREIQGCLASLPEAKAGTGAGRGGDTESGSGPVDELALARARRLRAG
jgi:DNA-binding transcriptional MerR regulator